MNRCQVQIVGSAAAVALLGGCAAFQPQARLEIRAVETAGQATANSDALAEGRALLNLGQNANAISAFRAALRETPDNGDAYNGLAIAYDRIGRQDLAQRYFELAVSVDPENDRFRGNLARLFNRTGQPQLALGLIDNPVSQAGDLALARPTELPPAVASPVQQLPFVAALSTETAVETASPVPLDIPALATLDMISPVTDIVMTQPAPLPQLQSQPAIAAPVVKAVYRRKAALMIRPASIDATQLPKPAAPRSPKFPDERLPADLPRQVVAPAEREGIRLERVSLGEVRLVTRASTPKLVVKGKNFDSFGVRLATWLPGAIAVEQIERKAHIASSPTLKAAIARAQIETAIEDIDGNQDEIAELTAFTYAFFHGDDVEEVNLTAL